MSLFFKQQMHAWAEVCHLLQSSKSSLTGFLCSIGWRIIDQTRLSSNTPRTPKVFLIQQSWVIVTFHCKVICAHAYTWRKNGVHGKGSHSSSVSGSNLVLLQTYVFLKNVFADTHKNFKAGYLVYMVKGKLAVVCFISRDDVIKIVYTIQITTVHLQSGQGLGEGMNLWNYGTDKGNSSFKKQQ